MHPKSQTLLGCLSFSGEVLKSVKAFVNIRKMWYCNYDIHSNYNSVIKI